MRSFRKDKRLPRAGTVLEREHNGKKHRVTVTAEGFAYGRKVYTSLSTIANEITGKIWNGFVFFGLKGEPAWTKSPHAGRGAAAKAPKATAKKGKGKRAPKAEKAAAKAPRPRRQAAAANGLGKGPAALLGLLGYIADAGPVTDDQIQERFGLKSYRVSRLRTKLIEQGKVAEAGVGTTSKGKSAKTWRATGASEPAAEASA